MKQTFSRGFTLIELLVVIAIIGILSSVVLASLNSARMKSRDARRIADLKQIQTALELFYDGNQGYPILATASATGGAAETMSNVAGSVAGVIGTYIPSIPQDPQEVSYIYQPLTSASAQCTTLTSCSSYVLRATIEDGNLSALSNDVDTATGGVTCTDSSSPFYYCVRP